MDKVHISNKIHSKSLRSRQSSYQKSKTQIIFHQQSNFPPEKPTFFKQNTYKQEGKELKTFEEIVGSMAFFSRTKLPFLQKVRFALGSNKPGSVQRHFTSGPIFSMTSNLTIPPSTKSSSPTFTSDT
ncbi:pyruvate kinase isozyme A, chloroplastic [Trifolium repens]|nr:pyruvate kinase isozyme A, chloroplastic [Trifolium repens]